MSISPPWLAIGGCDVGDIARAKKGATLLRTASTRSSTRLLNPLAHRRRSRCRVHRALSPRHERLAPSRSCASAPRPIGGGVLCRPSGDSDHLRYGTQDVKTPCLAPLHVMRAAEGSFTSWVPRVAVGGPMSGDQRAQSLRRVAENPTECARVFLIQNAVCGSCAATPRT